jgi:hypothetical protein
MELETKLADTKKESAQNEATLNHWQGQHDELQLEEVECVLRGHLVLLPVS